MKALAIVALIFAALSIFIPVGGIFIAMLCSVFALITFYKQPTLSGITFGINILSTAFFSPSLLIAAGQVQQESGTGGGLYWFYVGFHIVLLVIAVIISMILKGRANKKQKRAAA